MLSHLPPAIVPQADRAFLPGLAPATAPPSSLHCSALMLPEIPPDDDDRLIFVFANSQGICQVCIGDDEPTLIVTPHAFIP
jgi:hypothetical protein